MRDKNLNSIFSFSNSVKIFIERKLYSIEILRTAVVTSPTFQGDFYIVFPRKLYEIRGLCLIVHYLPDYLRYRILLDLEEKIVHFSLKEQLELKILLSSRENALFYLFETKKYTSHEIFGNIINNGLRALSNIKFYRKSTKIVWPQWKRGYDDKGSLRSIDRWLPQYDYTLTEKQNKYEKEKYLHQKSLNFIIYFIEKKIIEKKLDL